MILTAWLFILKNWRLILISLGVLLVIGFVERGIRIDELVQNQHRLESNLEQITKKGDTELNVTHSEFSHLNTPTTQKVDSVAKVAKSSIRSLQKAEVISTTYKDTTTVKAKHDSAQVVSPPGNLTPKFYKIPVHVDESCWGMKGYILTSDPKAELTITSRTAINSIQRLEVSKRFLGFLWYTKKSVFKAYTDCGEIKIDKINFVKQ